MTDIATNLNTIDGSLSDIKTAIVNKGVTPSGNITTFATAIDNIPSSGGSTPIKRAVKANYYVDTNGVVHNLYKDSNETVVLNANATTLSDGTSDVFLSIASETTIEKLDLSAIESGSPDGIDNLYYSSVIINNNSDLTVVDLSSLITLDFSINFSWCGNLAEVYMPALTTIDVGGSLDHFIENTDVTEFKLDNLTDIVGGSLAYFLAKAQGVIGDYTFPKLSNISSSEALNYAFVDSSISAIYFPALTSQSFGNDNTQFDNMLLGCSNVTVHFPSNLPGIIMSMPAAGRGFDGSGTIILFDLPATS